MAENDLVKLICETYKVPTVLSKSLFIILIALLLFVTILLSYSINVYVSKFSHIFNNNMAI